MVSLMTLSHFMASLLSTPHMKPEPARTSLKPKRPRNFRGKDHADPAQNPLELVRESVSSDQEVCPEIAYVGAEHGVMRVSAKPPSPISSKKNRALQRTDGTEPKTHSRTSSSGLRTPFPLQLDLPNQRIRPGVENLLFQFTQSLRSMPLHEYPSRAHSFDTHPTCP
ncbi:hypothetical protein EDC27_2679 [Desulfosoma caldarium]|uniref:Uncharacterized protein n=1 Tax=Desulfosoma caldarium TaxID=610254 RepID=A0A3N1UHP1_9BACT|nr:hypothetical protein EDC27_2679 [Desulfosoma caldarium]